MQHRLAILPIAIGVQLLVGCTDSSGPGPGATLHVAAVDQCDSASFNAGLGAGTCSRNGSVTLAQFNSELSAQHSVAAWTFVPTTLNARVGDNIVVTNQGGEVHTFTEVEDFGGGVVPSLNNASGNPVEAPECTHLAAADFIAAGATTTESAENSTGTERYQCCIHPWMRTVVTVSSR